MTDKPPINEAVKNKALGAMLMVLFFWSLGPSFSKRVGTPATVTVFYRMWLAVPLLWFLATATGHRPTRSTLRRAAMPGAMFGINLLFFFNALRHASIANVLMISALQPAVMLFAAKPVFGTRIRAADVAWTVLAVAGAAFAVLGSDSSTTKTTSLGIFYAVGALLAFCAYFILSKMVQGSHREGDGTTDASEHPLAYMAGVMTAAAIVVTPVSVLTNRQGQLTRITWVDAGWLVLIVCIPTMGHVLMTWCHRFIDVNVSSLILLVQPVTSALVAWPMNGEPVSWQQGVGALIVLVGVYGVIRPGPSAEVAPVASTA